MKGRKFLFAILTAIFVLLFIPMLPVKVYASTYDPNNPNVEETWIKFTGCDELLWPDGSVTSSDEMYCFKRGEGVTLPCPKEYDNDNFIPKWINCDNDNVYFPTTTSFNTIHTFDYFVELKLELVERNDSSISRMLFFSENARSRNKYMRIGDYGFSLEYPTNKYYVDDIIQTFWPQDDFYDSENNFFEYSIHVISYCDNKYLTDEYIYFDELYELGKGEYFIFGERGYFDPYTYSVNVTFEANGIDDDKIPDDMCVIEFDEAEGEGVYQKGNVTYMICKPGESIKLPYPIHYTYEDGEIYYYFMGWSDYKGGVYCDGEEYKVTAKYTKLESRLYRTINPDVVDFQIYSYVSFKYNNNSIYYFKGYRGASVIVPDAPEPDILDAGKAFIGWKSNELLLLPGDTYKTTEYLVSFYPVWGDFDFEVKFSLGLVDDSENIPQNMYALNNRNIKLPENNSHKEGLEFVGWSDGKNVYKAGDYYAVNKNVTLTAQWKIRTAVLMENTGELLFTIDNYDDLYSMLDSKKEAYEIYVVSNLGGDQVPESIPWYNKRDKIKTVTFDESFKEFKPTSTKCWFYECGNLEKINNIEYLNTSETTTMQKMFAGCSSLTALDLSKNDTTNVTIFSFMFSGCTNIKNLDLTGKFNTKNGTSFNHMFSGCSSMETINLRNFDTNKVSIMSNMFKDCSSLKKLDLTTFNINDIVLYGNNAQLTASMFSGCGSLEKICASESWSNYNVSISKGMFEGCTSLKGENGTVYDGNHVDGDYAVIDAGSEAPGYFSMYAYEVVFKGGKGSTGTAPSKIKAKENDTIKLPANTFEKEEYKFNGWSDGEKTYAEGAEYTVNRDVTFTAKWTKKTYKVTFSGGDNVTGSAPSAIKGAKNDVVKLPSNPFTKSGYKFMGWTDGKKTYGAGDNYTISGEITLKAKWEKLYTVKFTGGDGATGKAPTNVKGIKNEKITLPKNTFTKKGYTFAGWSDGSGLYKEGAKYTIGTKNVKFTAKWEKEKTDVSAFINRCYQVVLGRKADTEGYTYWLERLQSGKACGAQLGYGFIFSDEYKAKKTTNEQYIRDLYQMFFGREADEEGFKYWKEQMKKGSDREVVFAGFANSDEFYDLCNNYGIARGIYIKGMNIDKQGGINGYVARLYKVCLSRLPDKDGQADWVNKIISGEKTGTEVARGFIMSDEFKSLNLNNENYVAYLYRAFFGHEGGKEGMNYWLNMLKEGKSREEVFEGFASSDEFKNLCRDYGINP